jgi:hypothetical protein
LDQSYLFIKISVIFYILSFILSLKSNQLSLIKLILLAGVLANGASVVLRYITALPMSPMYMDAAGILLFLGITVLFTRKDNLFTLKTATGLVSFLSILAVFFPKDYYLPFIKTLTVFSHLFIIFGIAGKGCFLIGGLWGISSLFNQGRSITEEHQKILVKKSFIWIILGFSLWTLSMFFGELWSYIGWGTPVEWEDPVITTAMAIWFYYIGLLHIHLTNFGNSKWRGIITASGVPVILFLTYLTNLGPYRNPF